MVNDNLNATISSNGSSSNQETPIPIRQVALNKKFVPLVVSYASTGDSREAKITAKLFYDQKIQSFIQDVLNQ